MGIFINRDVPEPTKFKFGGLGDEFLLAIEVTRYFGLTVGSLFHEYPGLYRRQLDLPELIMLHLSGISSNSLLTVVKAAEIEQLLSGNDQTFKKPRKWTAIKTKEQTFLQKNVPTTIGSSSKLFNLHTKTLFSSSDFKKHTQFANNPFKGHCNPIASSYSLLDSPTSSTLTDLIPISIDVEFNGYRIRDNFLWNLHESRISPKLYSEILCSDMELPKSCASEIESTINEQIDDYSLFKGMLSSIDGQKEQRAKLNLDVFVGNIHYTDQIEWDLNSNQENSAEIFSEVLCSELGLGGEYETAITHSIREQVYLKKKFSIESHSIEKLGNIPFPPLRIDSKKKDYLLWGPNIELTTTETIEHYLNAKLRETRRLNRSRKRRKTVDSVRLK